MVATFMAALLMALPGGNYNATLILKEDKRTVRKVFFAGEDTLAGYVCESYGMHGEDNHGKPFVWSKGKLYRLPLGKSKWGHVLAGNDHLLVGDVVDDDWVYRPVAWTPDAKSGWAKSHLKIVSSKRGRARIVGSDDEIWVQNDEGGIRRLRDRNWVSFTPGKFDMVGVDDLGRLYGNVYSSRGEGGRLEKTAVALFDPSDSNLKMISGQGFSLSAVSGAGEFVGQKAPKMTYPLLEGERAVMWQGNTKTYLIDLRTNKDGWTESDAALAMNARGAAVGYWCHGKTRRGFVWENGAFADLYDAVEEVHISDALAINDLGQIAASADYKDGSSLYLLSPK